MKPIITERLILRQWRNDDRELFHRINSDDRVMQYFPIRRSRAQSDALMDEFRQMVAKLGYGFAAVEIAETGECAGFAGIMPAELVSVVPSGSVEIGWRLAAEFWGKGYATEAAKAWLRFGFVEADLDTIMSYAVAANTPSIAVMRRIGMMPGNPRTFRNPNIGEDQPDLQNCVLYNVTRTEWQKQNGAA